MPIKWLQERAKGSKNEPGIPPHRAFCGRARCTLRLCLYDCVCVCRWKPAHAGSRDMVAAVLCWQDSEKSWRGGGDSTDSNAGELYWGTSLIRNSPPSSGHLRRGGGTRGEGASPCERMAARATPQVLLAERDLIVFFMSLICTGARRNSATCGTNQCI